MSDNSPTPPPSPNTPVFPACGAEPNGYSPSRPEYVFDGDWDAFCNFDWYEDDSLPSDTALVNQACLLDPIPPTAQPPAPLTWDELSADVAFTSWYLEEMRNGVSLAPSPTPALAEF